MGINMAYAEKVDYSLIPVIEVARKLFGPESPDRSTRTEKHFPGHAGLFVNPELNAWYSHGKADGGDAIDLIRFEAKCDFKGALDWLRANGFDQYDTLPPHRRHPRNRGRRRTITSMRTGPPSITSTATRIRPSANGG
jgi:hypothetical protein